jgi:uncharacterized membrane protein YciS (DUF1049 family)
MTVDQCGALVLTLSALTFGAGLVIGWGATAMHFINRRRSAAHAPTKEG